ncbi:MAG TPA: exonuclease domain-containing protein [Chloroflexota bacterium]
MDTITPVPAAPLASVRAVPLTDLTYTVVDVETTGLTPRGNGITEVCALRVQMGRVVDRFSTLVNPGMPIPLFIQSMTGITDSMVRDAPSFREIVPALKAFIGESVLVAHNAPFDLSFLNYGLYSCGHNHLHNQVVDTLRMARRLLPDLRRGSLDAVTTHLGISIADRHRAYGDALATAMVLVQLLPVAHGHGIQTDAQLIAFLGHGETEARGRRLAAVTPRGEKLNRAARLAVLAERCRHFPDAPGVYIFRSPAGEVLYVGKAISLRKRLASYFSGTVPSKIKRMLRQAESVEHHQAGSELEALLDESRLIKQYQPPFNTLLRSYRDYPFIKIDGKGTYGSYPNMYTTRQVSDDGAIYFGPFRGRQSTEMVLEILRKCFRLFDDRCPNHGTVGEGCLYFQMHRCIGPCIGQANQATYAAAVAEVCRLLEGDPRDFMADLVRRREEASERLDYETAAVYRDAIVALAHAVSHRRLLTPAIDGLNVLAACPSLHEGWVELFVFGDGRLMARTRIDAGQLDRHEVEELLASMAKRRLASGDRPAVRIDAESLDQVNIITSWLDRQGIAASTIVLDRGWADGHFEEVVDRVVRAAKGAAGAEEPE